MTGASSVYTDQDYENYLNEPRRIYNEMLRDKGQSFSDAMCEGSIVAGLENGEEILDMIRKAGN
jgi:hypothetical protein